MLDFLRRSQKQEEIEHQEWIAHEIHDGACQYAVAAQMAFDSFRSTQLQNFVCDRSGFDMGMKFLNHANEELRRVVHGLHPIQLAAGDLPKAIASLVAEIQAAGGPDIEVCCDIQPELLSEVLELEAFRIVQESLANACRHSKSNGILVGLTQDDESLCIQVQDWGVGFDPNSVSQDHYGLDGIRRRVKSLRGIATIHSSPGEGTLITVELPLKG